MTTAGLIALAVLAYLGRSLVMLASVGGTAAALSCCGDDALFGVPRSAEPE